MTYWFNKELKNIISETYDRTLDSIYPCSMNFPLWHSGIHIDTNNSCIKNIISKGEIIASYINTDYINDTQSDSFILVKHCIKINKDEKFFYVLYSNLQPLKAYKFQKKANNEVVDEILLSKKSEFTCSFQDLPFYCKSQLSDIKPKNQVKYIDKDVFEGNSVFINDKKLLLQNDKYVLPPPLNCTVIHNKKTKTLMTSNLAFDKDKNFEVKIKNDTLFYSNESKTQIGKLNEGYYQVVDKNTSGDYITIQISGSNITKFIYEGIVNFPKSKENIFYRVAANDIYAAIRNADNTENPESLQKFQKNYFPLSEITDNNNLNLYRKILNDEGFIYLKTSFFSNLQKTYRITYNQLNSLKTNNEIFCKTFLSVKYIYDSYYIISFENLKDKINKLELYDKKKDYICIYSNNGHYLPIEESGNKETEDSNTIYFTLEDSIKNIKYISLSENDFDTIKNYIKSIKIIENLYDSKQLYHFYCRDNSYLSGIFKYPFKIKLLGKLKAPLSHLTKGSLYLTQATKINVSIQKKDIVDARAYATIKNAQLSKEAIPLKRNNEIVGLLEEDKINFSENIFNQISKDSNLTCTINNNNFTISLDDIEDAKLTIVNDSIKDGSVLPSGANIGIGNNRFGKRYIDLSLFTDKDKSNFTWEREYIPKGTKLYKTKDTQLTKKVFFPDRMKITRKKETVNGQKVVKIQPSLLMFRVYYDYVNQKRIKDFKENDTKTEPFNKDKKGQIELYCGLKKGFLYKDNKVSIIQNSDNADMETLRKLIEDYLNGDQIFISYENKTTNGYYCIYADCSGLNFYEDYYLTDNPEIEDETESVYIDNEKANILKELALKSSFEIEMSDEITETDNEYFATFNEGKIQSKDKKIWKSINVNGLGDFYVPESQQLLKKDFLDWKTFKEVNNKAKNKIEFDFQTVDKDLEINIDYSKVAAKLGLKNISEASYNLLIKILINNDSVDIFNSESSDDLVKDSANKILNAFYNGKFIHPLECDSTLYNEDIKELINVSDENYDKQKNSINMFSKMKKVLKENLFAFYNPICFLDKLDKAGLFEFNPYKGKKYAQLLNGNLDPIFGDVDITTTEVYSNPGITTLYNEAKDYGAKYVDFEGVKYSGVNGFFNAQYRPYHTGYTEYWHEGIDFRGKTGATVISLINGTVIKCGKRTNLDQGYILIQSAYDKTLYYLALHVDHNSLNVKEKSTVYPGMKIAQTVFMSDGKGGDTSHLHVSIIKYEGKKPIGNIIGLNGELYTWGERKPNQKIWKTMINPFNYNDLNTWRGRY